MQKTQKIGKYEVLEKIGQGSFGVVFRGRDPFIKRLVAIKVCSADDEDLRKRFYREAQIAGTLQHRNLVTVFDFGVQDEIPYMVQEYLEGEDLADVIERREPLPLGERLDILMQTALGLHYAHAQGVIHRDIKPGNVRLLPGGHVKIMDFGIAKLASSKTRLTEAGTTIGTAGYLSPEQLQAGELDHRTDIFSFGVLAYELLSYERPFSGTTFSKVAYQILYTPALPLPTAWPDCPAELERIVSKCLEKRREDRYGDCQEIVEALETLRDSGSIDLDAAVGAVAEPRAGGIEATRRLSLRRGNPPAAVKEPSPEATVAIQLPLAPPPPTPPPPALDAEPPVEEELVEEEPPTRPLAVPPAPEPASSEGDDGATAQVDLQEEAEEIGALIAEGKLSSAMERLEETLSGSDGAPQEPVPQPPPPTPVTAVAPAPAPTSGPESPAASPEAPEPTPPSKARLKLPPVPLAAAGALLLILVLAIVFWPGGDDSPAPVEQPSVTTEAPPPSENVAPVVETGIVRIRALPWARVATVVSATGESWEVPPGLVTPTHLELPPGSWKIELEPQGLAQEEPPLAEEPSQDAEAAQGQPTDEVAVAEPELPSCAFQLVAGGEAECTVRLEEPSVEELFTETGWWK